MGIKEFAIEWMKKKYPKDYATTIDDDVLEFAQDWAEHMMEHILEELKRIIADSKSETPPSQP